MGEVGIVPSERRLYEFYITRDVDVECFGVLFYPNPNNRSFRGGDLKREYGAPRIRAKKPGPSRYSEPLREIELRKRHIDVPAWPSDGLGDASPVWRVRSAVCIHVMRTVAYHEERMHGKWNIGVASMISSVVCERMKEEVLLVRIDVRWRPLSKEKSYGKTRGLWYYYALFIPCCASGITIFPISILYSTMLTIHAMRESISMRYTRFCTLQESRCS